MVIHGGGWLEGDKSSFATREHGVPGNIVDFAALGFVAVTINYRLSAEAPFPAALEDCKCAVRWLRAHAREYHLDPDHIGAFGNSAGGHLAMLAAYSGDAGPIRAVVNFYGPGDLTALYEHPPAPDPLHVRAKLEALLGGTPTTRPELYRSASPVSLRRADLPPTLHIQGTGDTVVQYGLTRDLHRQLLGARLAGGHRLSG